MHLFSGNPFEIFSFMGLTYYQIALDDTFIITLLFKIPQREIPPIRISRTGLILRRTAAACFVSGDSADSDASYTFSCRSAEKFFIATKQQIEIKYQNLGYLIFLHTINEIILHLLRSCAIFKLQSSFLQNSWFVESVWEK